MTRVICLKHAEREIRQKLAGQKEISRLLEQHSFEGVRAFVKLVGTWIEQLNERAELPQPTAILVREAVLQTALPSFLCYYLKEYKEAARLLVATWTTYATEFPKKPPTLWLTEFSRPHAGFRKKLRSWSDEKAQEATEIMTMFNAAVSEEISESSKLSRGRQVLRRLMSHLGLSFDDVGRMLGVSGETARRWERGASKISDDYLARLDEMDDALRRLIRLFLPERLSLVIRRSAELFDRERAIDWILRGRIRDVVDLYELALSFQA
ncbi:helix-turn-helix domain-containing protein [Acidobacteria bacterium AH-259-L09]|nr:helix-turn-helix domain-containing protein [Acidobacteria bacterium AH-259-L09]